MNEDQREKLQLFLSRLGSISPKRWIMFTVITILLGISISVWSNFGFVIVNIPNGIDTKSSLKYLNSDNSNTPLSHIGPFVFVPVTNKAFTVSASNYQSVISVAIPWFHITTVNLPANITNGIEKYTADSPGCANYDPENDRLIDYKCQNPTEFSTTNMKTGFIQSLTPLLTTDRSTPFLNGVIGVTGNAVGQLLYQDYSGIANYLKKPDDLSLSSLASSTVVTDRNDKTSTTFALLPLSGDIYIGNYTNNEVTYSKIIRPKQWNTEMANVCQILLVTVYCYQGVSGAAPNINDDQPENNTIDGSIVKINISTPDKLTLQRYAVDPKFTIDGIYVASDGSMTATSVNRLYNFSFSGNTVTFNQLTGDVKNTASTGDGVYFLKDNAVYKLQKNAGVAVFKSDDLNIDHIFSDSGSVFLAARSSKVGTDLGIYKVTPDPNETTRLLLNIMTNQSEYSDDISDMNFIKDIIFIRVKITINKQPNRTSPAIDQNEYNQIKNRIDQQLKNSGLTVPDSNIIFSY